LQQGRKSTVALLAALLACMQLVIAMPISFGSALWGSVFGDQASYTLVVTCLE